MKQKISGFPNNGKLVSYIIEDTEYMIQLRKKAEKHKLIAKQHQEDKNHLLFLLQEEQTKLFNDKHNKIMEAKNGVM
jgi:hypothetical protein